jgi:nucleotide-binding universal stress UspA family protein
MSGIRAILIPLDGSELAECALPAGISLARRLNAFVHLVRVHTAQPFYELSAEVVALTPENEAEQVTREEGYLEAVAADIRAAERLAVSTAVVKGGIVPALQFYAERHGIGLVVMSSHGHGGLRRALLGSVADHLLRSVTIPVLLITPATPHDMGSDWPRRILLPLDGSGLSESAVDLVESLDPGRTSHLLLTTVSVRQFPSFTPWGLMPETVRPEPEPADPPERAYLERVGGRLKSAGFTVHAHRVEGGKVAREILKLGAARQCDLIVMATHGAGGLDRVMFGSVTDQVVRHSTIPVLAVRPVSEEAPANLNQPLAEAVGR